MDDKKKIEEEVQEVPKQGSGSLLAAARKQQNRTVEEIADELNLSATQIRTIELDQSEGLPEPTYVRGYIRSYARLLGLDVDEVLDHYLNPNWQKGTRLDDMPRGIGSANNSDSRRTIAPGKIVVLILIAALISFLWLSGKLDGLLSTQPVAVVAPVAINSGNTNSSTQTTLPALASDDSSEQQGLVELEARDEFESEPTENQLILTFKDTSWVDIRDGDGKRLAYKSYARGDDLTVTAATSMSVFLGNAKAVTATFNGETYDISKYREGVFARFSVGQ